MRRDRPGPRPDSRAGRGGRRPSTKPRRGAWDRVAPSEALEATWRLVRETNAALEAAEPWKAEPGPAVDAVLGDALEALRIVAVLASPALSRAAQEIWRRHRACPGRVDDQRLPEAAAWGGYPGGLDGGAGRAALPAITDWPAVTLSRPVRDRCGPTATATSPTTGSASAASTRPGPAGRDPADHRRHRRRRRVGGGHRGGPRATTGCGPPSACTPTTPSTAWTASLALLAEPDPVVVGVGECGLDYHYDHSPRAVQRAGVRGPGRLAAPSWTWPW